MVYLTPGNPNKRLKKVVAFVLGLAVVFGIRLVDLQIIEADAINAKSYEKRAVTRVIPALRGSILDANGEVLARTVFRYDINVAPSKVAPVSRTVDGKSVEVSVDEIAGEIGIILQMDKAEVLTKISGVGEYAQVKKRVDAEMYRKIRDLDIPWMYYDPIPDRLYPNGAVAGNILGFLDSEGIGVEGVEAMYEKCLAGQDGSETFEKGVDGIKIPSSAVITKEAVPGRDIKITINADLQYFAQQVMADTVRNTNADWGTAIVIEAKTGRILAAAEAPSVDPNAPEKSDAEDRGSRIFRTAFEPGSTLKTITAATVVDTGAGNAETQAVVPYAFTLPKTGYVVTDSHSHPNEKLTLTGILRDSSNTGIIKIGSSVDYKTRYEYLEKFGLGKKTSINFPGEGSGLLNAVEDWDGIKQYVSMFGQGISVTPIQSAMMYQAIANQGVRLNPILVEGCEDDGGNIPTAEVKPGVKVISPEAANETMLMMEKVVEHGPIGHYGYVPGYRLGAKTGTAEIRDEATGRYGNLYAVSYIGAGPVEDPEYVVAVTAFKTRTIRNSLAVATPFKRIMQQVLRTYRVPPSTTKSPNIAEEW
ncbi:peptidoglycan D,D-transpeptidase FtsI family protein [Rhodoluna limnophila]|uniref:peptidoglycan D,D-transpeptidase FtsI family protein n=1 Tax=Rhodoluna limnophila TaxID=232537 RepID=UPI00110710FB|nr:penicillin-binding protein 2 [Rhodoluna limnophila]